MLGGSYILFLSGIFKDFSDILSGDSLHWYNDNLFPVLTGITNYEQKLVDVNY